MKEQEKLYIEIGQKLKGEQSQMFGKPCFKINGKAFISFFQDEMVFKLSGDSHKEALSLDGAQLFDPSGKKRPMKEWVQVPYDYKDQWAKFAKALNPQGNENSKDGMDCVLTAFDFENKTLEFAAANNPLWLVRDEQIIDYKADKMPVGKGEHNEKSFTLQQIEIKKGDLIYLFTDGYADQFGGPKGKKFMYKQLSQIILANHKLPMNQQKERLIDSFNFWKGEHEQVDDVLVIGIRI